MAEEVAHVRKSKTLFLRNLPFTTTNEKLEEIFGDIGPIKTCFVVKPKGAEKCRGFGYVAYSMLEDAEKAKDTVKTVDGRKIFITYAESKKDNRQRMGVGRSVPVKVEEVKEDRSEEDSDEEKEDTKVKSNEKDRETLKYLQAKTLLVSGWKEGTTQDDVQKYMAKINVKGIAKVEYPMRNCDQPTALVRLKCIRNTKAGQRKLECSQDKGETLHVRRQKEEFKVVSQKSLKQSRLIVRNLSFKCKEDDLKKYFEKFGEITEVKIPLKPDGRMLGFGFVQFVDVTHANKAMSEMNMKPILGRPVAVDWTLPKDKFVSAQTNKPTARTSTPSVKAEIKQEVMSDEETSDEESGSVDGKEEEKSGDDDSDESEMEEESNDESDEDDLQPQSEDEGFDDDGDDDDDDDDDGESDDSNKKKAKQKKKTKDHSRKSDVEEGRTLFIRNVGFETEEETLEEHLEEFGRINYCRIVMDPNTEHSKGLAFVQFRTTEAAEKCLQKATDESRNGGITVDSRRLCVAVAVSRDKAKQFKQEEKKKVEDKRNLHLIREGMIRPGTQSAQGLSKEDLQKRQKVESMKREKLKNPNIFISTTRLCVRNLPIQLEDKELKQLFLKVAGDKKAFITECRIMRDLERVNAQGKAKSRGYGFVNFTEHKHALQALREVTASSDLFQEKRNLIVDFSLENKGALLAKEKKLERVKARQFSLQQKREMAKEADKAEEGKKKGRGKQDKKQKDKLIDKFIGQINHEEGSENKKLVKGMPSHWGPKVRHKPRQSQAELEKKQKKKAKKQRQRQQRQAAEDNTQHTGKRQLTGSDIQAPPSKKRKRPRKEKLDDFDRMVNKYKQSFTSATGKSSKWFES